MWGGYGFDIPTLPNLSVVPNQSGTTSDWAYIGSETNYNGNLRWRNLGDSGYTETETYKQDGLYYYSVSAQTKCALNRMCPSPFDPRPEVGGGPAPYTADLTDPTITYPLNPDYVRTGATADFDGQGNTAKILVYATAQTDWREYGHAIVNAQYPGWYPAAEACWRYNPLRHYAATSADTRQGEWYLPSAGELGYIIPRLSVLNRIISAINTGYGHTVALQIDIYAHGYLASGELSGGNNVHNIGVYNWHNNTTYQFGFFGAIKDNTRGVRALQIN
jgi:hypothetical protein